jgi:hypothetical protein
VVSGGGTSASTDSDVEDEFDVESFASAALDD